MTAGFSSSLCARRFLPGRVATAWIVAFGLALGLLPITAHAAETQPVTKEYQVKAAFLYNFTKFVEWPDGAFATATTPLVIAVFGRNPFGDELQRVVAGRQVNGRKIEVKTINTAEDVRGVQLLFFVAGEEPRMISTLAALPANGLLTVGEIARGQGAGMISFSLDEGKVRFEINQALAQQNGLRISAQLLQLASAVRREK